MKSRMKSLKQVLKFPDAQSQKTSKNPKIQERSIESSQKSKSPVENPKKT